MEETNVQANTEVLEGFEEATQTVAAETEETTQETTQETTFEIPYKFLGQEGKVTSLDEARELIEKGMNHDRLREKLQQYETKLKELSQSTVESEVNRLIEETGMSEEVAREYVELKQKERQRTEEEQTKQNEIKMEEQRKTVLMEFNAEFPDVKPADWSQEMKEAYAKGESISSVYYKQQYQKLAQIDKAVKQNEKNKEKSVGSVTGNESDGIEALDKQIYEMMKG